MGDKERFQEKMKFLSETHETNDSVIARQAQKLAEKLGYKETAAKLDKLCSLYDRINEMYEGRQKPNLNMLGDLEERSDKLMGEIEKLKEWKNGNKKTD